MANKRITDVDFVDSLNSDESFFINQNNAIKQINKNNIVFGVENGGTGATTIEEVRTNLDVYSKSEIDSTVENALENAFSAFASSASIIIPADLWAQHDSYDGLYYANMNGAAPYVNSESILFVAPAGYPKDNFDAYVNNNVRACEQGLETIGFIADTKPEIDIIVNYAVFA